MAARAANLRSGPGATYAVTGNVSEGQTLQVTGQDPTGQWYQLSDGRWVAVQTTRGCPVVPVAESVPPLPPTLTPTRLPASTATAVPATTAPIAGSQCPAWYHPPEPGLGQLLLENHDMEPNAVAYVQEVRMPERWTVPPKQGGVPGRLLISLPPGAHSLTVDRPMVSTRMLEVQIVADRLYVSPILNPRGEAYPPPNELGPYPVYPMQPPAGCP